VRDREPVFTPAPTLPVDVKLDQDETPRTEVQLADFEVADEVRRLLLQLDERKDWVMDKIEVRGGLPRRIVFAVPLPGGVAHPSTGRLMRRKKWPKRAGRVEDWAGQLTGRALIRVGWPYEYENESAPVHMLHVGRVKRPE